MEYVSLFIWLAACLAVAGIVDRLLQGALSYRLVQILVLPGAVVRNLSQSLAALMCGATLTDANAYTVNSDGVKTSGGTPSQVAGALTPVVPLLGCGAAAVVLQGAVGGPLPLSVSAPTLGSFSAQGVESFVSQTVTLVRVVALSVWRADFAQTGTWVMLVLSFGLAAGMTISFSALKRAVVGAVVLVGAVGVLDFVLPRLGLSGGWLGSGSLSLRPSIESLAGVASVVLIVGLAGSVVVIALVKAWNAVGAGSSASGRSAGGSRQDSDGGETGRRKAA